MGAVPDPQASREAYRVMLWAGPPGYPTPFFSPSDPIVCHTLKLRPSLWAVVFDTMQTLGEEYSWIQEDPANALPGEVAEEINKATDEMVFAGCAMIGQVIMWAGAEVPDFCLPCDGEMYMRDDWPDLYDVLDGAFILDEDWFVTPELIERFALFGTGGAGPIGDTGGEPTVTLTVAQMPAHTHGEQDPGLLNVQSGVGATPLSDPGLPSQTGSTGGGEAHNNMPPYLRLRALIIGRIP